MDGQKRVWQMLLWLLVWSDQKYDEWITRIDQTRNTGSRPELEEDVDPVEDDVGQLGAEGEILEEEGNEGGIGVGVFNSQFVVHKVLKL